MVDVMDQSGMAPAPETQNAPPQGDAASPFKTAEDANDAAEQRKALVKKILDDVSCWKEHHKKAFQRMKRNVRFVKNADYEQWRGAGGVTPDDDRYVANITHRFIQQKVSSLYARDPRVKAKRRPTIDYIVWDGRQETLQTAEKTVSLIAQGLATQGINTVTPGLPATPMPGAPGAPMPPGAPGQAPAPAPMPPVLLDPATAVAIVKEAVASRQRRDLIDRVGKTAEILFQHTIDTAVPSFKTRMKQGVRRSATTGIAWIKLDFERAYSGFKAQTQDKIKDFEDRINKMQALAVDVQTGKIPDGDPRIEELQQGLNEITSKPDMLVREGIVFDFPKSWDVIPDDECRQLVGLIGCKRMAHQFEGTPESIKEQFAVDVGTQFTAYRSDGKKKGRAGSTKDCLHWYEVYDSTVGLVYTVCEGYPDFLCEPAPPRVEVPQFFPFYPIVLNEVENDEDLYPPSDVDLIEHQQKELNRSREALRDHRIAAAPFWVSGKGKLSEDDKNWLMRRAPHDVVELMAMTGAAKVSDLFQAGPAAPIDMNLYSDAQIMQDILRAGGAQEANLGPTSSATATEAGIADNSRTQTVSSNVDDIDTALSQLTRDATLVMLREVSPDMAKRIAGPGAVWPEISSDDISGELYLDIVAGSSGKPNRARDAAVLERIMPLGLQVPGINPEFWAKKTVETVDDAVDMDDAILDGIPSVLAMNALIKGAPPTIGAPQNAPTGDPATDPSAQGEAGGDNSPAGMGVPGGPQPGDPAPQTAMVASTQALPQGQ
jgi:hypothetical protein